jgi:predicted negative regulator of RcsB-dependent stress response
MTNIQDIIPFLKKGRWKMIRKILCWLGWHKWKYYNRHKMDDNQIYCYHYQACKYCGKELKQDD